MTDDPSKEHLQTLQNILDHGNDWFRIEEPFAAEVDAVNTGRELELVRARGEALSHDFIDMVLRWDDDEGTRDLIRSEMRVQVLHEIALIRTAENDISRPATERIAARDLWKIISDGDEYRLGRLACRLDSASAGGLPVVPVDMDDVAPDLSWPLINGSVERWILGRETPHWATCDVFWAGAAIVSGHAELWVLEDRESSDMHPHLQVLVDCRHPGIAAIWGQSAVFPEESLTALLQPLIRSESLKPWRVQRGENKQLWPVWQDSAILDALKSYFGDRAATACNTSKG